MIIRRFTVDFVRFHHAVAAAAASDGRIKDEQEIDVAIRALGFVQRLHKNRREENCMIKPRSAL